MAAAQHALFLTCDLTARCAGPNTCKGNGASRLPDDLWLPAFGGRVGLAQQIRPTDPAVVAATIIDGDAGGSVITCNSGGIVRPAPPRPSAFRLECWPRRGGRQVDYIILIRVFFLASPPIGVYTPV